MMIRNFSTFTCRMLLISALMPLSACGMDQYNRSVESVHQPVVSTSTFAYDIGLSHHDNGLSDIEKARLTGWLDTVNAGYGDIISIAGGSSLAPYGLQRDIAQLLARRGITLGNQDAASSTPPPAGAVRLSLRRATASVPGCPDWSINREGNMSGGSSSNYGCGVNSNFAAMVADPTDLLQGKASSSDLEGATSKRAIESWQNQAPTGTGGLKTLSAGGN